MSQFPCRHHETCRECRVAINAGRYNYVDPLYGTKTSVQTLLGLTDPLSRVATAAFKEFLANWMLTKGGLTPNPNHTVDEMLWAIRVAGRSDTIMVDAEPTADPFKNLPLMHPDDAQAIVDKVKSDSTEGWDG